MNHKQALAKASRIADKLLFIDGINRMGSELVPRLYDVNSGIIDAGGYNRGELIEIIRSELFSSEAPNGSR